MIQKAGQTRRDPCVLGWFAPTHRLRLMPEGERHRLREIGYFGVLHNDTQDLLAQDLARIPVLEIWDGGREEGGEGSRLRRRAEEFPGFSRLPHAALRCGGSLCKQFLHM